MNDNPIYDKLAMERFQKQLDELPSVQVEPPRRWNVLVTAAILTIPSLAFWGFIVWLVIR